jgi:putative Holliday junction resolvase
MSKILGIDFGRVKIGLALADQPTRVALPWKVIAFADWQTEIKKVVSQEEIKLIIVGLPINLKGKKSFQTMAVEKFVQELKQLTPAKVEVVDERLTSKQAQKQMSSPGSQQSDDDALAASFILQSFLDKNNG